MTIYVATGLFILFYGLFVTKGKERDYCLAVAILFTLIIGLRGETVGTDTNNYKAIFETMKQMGFSDYVKLYGYKELLFYSFNKLLIALNMPFCVYLILEALALIVPLCVFVKGQSSIPWLSFLLFLCMGHINQAMNVSRQYVAMGFVFCAMMYAQRKELLRFILSILVASSFHTSSIVCLCLYPVFNYSKRSLTYFILCATISCFAFKPMVVKGMALFIPNVYYYEANGGQTLLALWIVFLLPLVYMQMVLRSRESELVLRLLCLSIVFHIFASNYAVIGRISYYFSAPFYLLFPNAIGKLFANQSKKLVIGFMALLVMVYYTVFYLPGGASNTVPYSFFF